MRTPLIKSDNNQRNLSRSSRSIFQGHARDNNTDKLYDPLRNALLYNQTYVYPDILQNGLNHSSLSHSKLKYGREQLQKIGKQTYIYEDRKLRPTHNFQLLPKNQQYQVIDVHQKYQPCISLQQLKDRTSRVKNEKIVYVYDDNKQSNRKTVATTQNKSKQLPKTKVKIALKKPPTAKINLFQTKSQSKFNMFSAIDYPINACIGNLNDDEKTFELQNQCIATRYDRAYDMNWSTELKKRKLDF